MFLFSFIHQGLGPYRFRDETRERRETMCLAVLFADSRINGGTNIFIKSSFMEILLEHHIKLSFVLKVY